MDAHIYVENKGESDGLWQNYTYVFELDSIVDGVVKLCRAPEHLRVACANDQNTIVHWIKDEMVSGSKIEHDPERRDFFWGIYLFWFGTDGNWWRPEFDAEVDYDNDKGHILHHVETLKQSSLILFSIRRKTVSYTHLTLPTN